jgi:thermitase
LRKFSFSMVLVSTLAACSTPHAVSPAVDAVVPPVGALGPNDPAAMLCPDAPGAETLGGRLHFNLMATEGPGELIIRYRKDPGNAASGRSLKMERTVAVRSTNRRTDILRLLRDPNIEFIEPDAPLRALYVPNDPAFNRQWGLAKIGAPAAWDQTFGANGPLVAVIDTGVNAAHPDLFGQVEAGYDFANKDNDPTDDQGHGTHVAGIIAAKGDNRTGALGVAPQARVLSIKALSASGSGSTTSIVESLNYAVQQGAKVINLSLGSPYRSLAMEIAVRNAQAAGCLVVAAAGNDGKDLKTYPAGYPGVISVASTTTKDARSSFSNFGTWVTMAAPGSSIYATYKSGYARLSGTSMAAPHVAGAAALLWSAHPDWDVNTLKTALTTTGDVTTGFAQGAPLRLNVAKALAFAPPTPAGPSTAPAATPEPTQAPSTAPAATPSPEPSNTPTPTPSPTPVPPAPPSATPTPASPQPPAPSPTAEPTVAPTAPPPENKKPNLEIKNIRVTASSVHVTWRTDEPTRSMIELGLKPDQFTARSQSKSYVVQRTWNVVRLPRKTTLYIRLTNTARNGEAVQTQVFAVTTK